MQFWILMFLVSYIYGNSYSYQIIHIISSPLLDKYCIYFKTHAHFFQKHRPFLVCVSVFVPHAERGHWNPLCVKKCVLKTQPVWEDWMTKGSRKLAGTHTCLEWLSCSDSFFPFQQMTAVVDKRCWFRGQIKPWTGKIMCLWSINTDTRCTGFTLKLSGPANGPLCAFQLSSTNHFRGLLLKAALDSEYGFCLRTLPRQWTD